MSLGNKLLELRKGKHLSQEEVADELNVTRQSVSKWETDQSTPDFDKIIPLCELYGISADELLDNKAIDTKREISVVDDRSIIIKRAKGIGRAILMYFIAVAWITVSIPFFEINPLLATAIFLLICGIATYFIIYTRIVYKKEKVEKIEQKKDNYDNRVLKQVFITVMLVTLIIYLLVSFMTMAWHITWILWIVSGLVMEIIKLVFTLKGDVDEEK